MIRYQCNIHENLCGSLYNVICASVCMRTLTWFLSVSCKITWIVPDCEVESYDGC